MRASGCMVAGGAEVLEVIDLPDPQPGPGEVLIRVAASTVNPADILLRSGAVPFVKGPFPHVPGLECAGIVVAVGEGSRWAVGDRVAAIVSFIPGGRGSHAELVVASDDSVARVPDDMNLAAAATIPMSGQTAQLALDRTGSGPRTIAVVGAAGAVGGFVLELAREAGVATVAVVRRKYFDRVRSLGADDVVESDADWPQAVRRLHPAGVDAVIDCALSRDVAVPAIRDGGKLITLRGFSGAFERGIIAEPISVQVYARDQAKLQRLFDLASEGRLSTFIHALVPFEQAAIAHELVEQGGLDGRAVLAFPTSGE